MTAVVENKLPVVTDGAAAIPKPETTTGPFRSQPDDFYNAIFYFSGMGSVIGSALSQGVYVAEQYRKNAIDVDDLLQDRQAALSRMRAPAEGIEMIGRHGGRLPGDDVVVTARGQAQNLSIDFQKLQTLLESLPVFTGNANQLPPTGPERRAGEIEQPIHGELYFRCKERFPVQPSPTPSRQTQPSPSHESLRSGYSGDAGSSSCHTDDVRRRRNYDDAVLADVARAAVNSFPLMPPPRPPGSRGSATPVKELQQNEDQASRKARRRDVNSSVTSSPLPPGYGSGTQHAY